MSPCSPPTPPDVRVRIRRFGKLRFSGQAAVLLSGRSSCWAEPCGARRDQPSSTSVGSERQLLRLRVSRDPERVAHGKLSVPASTVSFPFAAVGVSPLRRGDSASPFSGDESPAGAGFWCLTLLRLMDVSLSFPFGPLLLAVRSASSRRVAFPAGALAARIASADFSLRLAASPFQAQSEISPGKGHGFPRAAVESTSAPLGRKGLRSSVRSPWLPAPHIHHTRFCASGACVSCSSTRGFAPRFFQRRPRGRTGCPASSPCGYA